MAAVFLLDLVFYSLALESYRYSIKVFGCITVWPGQGVVCGRCGVVAVKSSDLEVKFESVRHPWENIEWISGYLALNAKVRAKYIHFGVINIRMHQQ